jgi:transaldolase/glucose-6-phosphate isomerase
MSQAGRSKANSSRKGPGSTDPVVAATLEAWRSDGMVQRLWARDAALWTGADEANWLAWLTIVEAMLGQLGPLTSLAAEIAAQAKDGGLSHCLLLGMGGSSLGPEVLAETFGHAAGFPELLVLDSTEPAQILAVERRLDLAKTIFIVSSKSGTTLEPDILKRYFFERTTSVLGPGRAAARFVAVTDPGSRLDAAAREEGFAHAFHGVPAIGGRYSVLSHFGMVPAAAIGLDVAAFLQRAAEMVRACGADAAPADNPGAWLGIVLGAAARQGRDKVTIVTAPALADFGAWLEQLLAESTGKVGKGLIPVDGEALGPPEVYGTDRLFAYVGLDGESDPAQRALDRLENAGHPVVRMTLRDRLDLGGEFFRWEMATAVAGAVLGVNPFDQPDVEASKVKTRELTDAFEKTGSLPAETPVFAGEGIRLYTDPRNAEALRGLGAGVSLESWLSAQLGRLAAGDYFAVLAYIERNAAHIGALQAIRHAVRDAKKVATCLGFGPRFLHSTGQAYKGGPNSGVFLQLTCDDANDLPVPGRGFSFGIVKAAQARGDFDVLAERGRRALRVHLGPDVATGLARLGAAVRSVLA